MSSPGARSGAAAACLLLWAAAGPARPDDVPLLSPPAPAVELATVRPLDASASACAECHAETAREWAASAHGLAWVDAEYQRSLKRKRRPQSCHGCHVPQPLLAEGELGRRPRARTEAATLDLGVGCEACHLGADGVQLGPRGTPTDAHASARSDWLRAPGSDALCMHCHSTDIGPVIGLGDDFVEAGMAARGLSCVGCHMAPVERRWADGDAVPVRLGRSHALQTPRDPAFLRLAVDVTRVDDGRRARVVVTNQAGHRVPGLIGRELRFTVEVLGADGAVVETVRRTIDTDAYLPVDGTLELPFTARGAVRVTGLHVDPRARAPIPFLDETLEAP